MPKKKYVYKIDHRINNRTESNFIRLCTALLKFNLTHSHHSVETTMRRLLVNGLINFTVIYVYAYGYNDDEVANEWWRKRRKLLIKLWKKNIKKTWSITNTISGCPHTCIHPYLYAQIHKMSLWIFIASWRSFIQRHSDSKLIFILF